MMRKRYQGYIAALGFSRSDGYVKESGGNPYAAKFVFNEAHVLGHVRVARSLGAIQEADEYLKGGLTGMPPAVVMEMLVIELANQFRLANKR
jgi:hypothetical protein